MLDCKLNSEEVIISPPLKLWPFLCISGGGHLAAAIIYMMGKTTLPDIQRTGYPIEIIYTSLEEEGKQSPPLLTKTPSLAVVTQKQDKALGDGEEVSLTSSSQSASKGLALQSGNPHPPYPSYAQENGIEGKVQVIVHVNRLGTVDAIKVAPPKAHPCLEKVVLETVSEWRFQPLNVSSAQEKYEFVFKLEA